MITPSSAVSYTSNGDGLRQSRTEGGNTRQWLWDPSTKLPLLLSDGTSTYLYGPASTPVAEVDSAGTIHYLHADNVGSVRMVTNSAAATIGTATYSAYGLVTTAGTSSRFGYAQAWTDPITELNYLRAREYDPAVGQFLQVDPAANDTHQPYAYAFNNPLQLNDPTGLCAGLFSTGSCDSLLADIQAQFDQRNTNIGNAWVGVGDGATFWGTESIRETIMPGSTCNVTKDGFYYTGVGVGILAITILSAGTADAVGAPRLAQEQQQLANAGSKVLPQLNRSFQFPGAGRGGSGVKDFVGPPNAIVRGASEGRVFLTDAQGKVILDITAQRVKPVVPGQGFVSGTGRKDSPTSEQLGWINQLWGAE